MAKKYKLHRVTEKDAKKLAAMPPYVGMEDLTGDCYLLVNKKGKPYVSHNELPIFKCTVEGRSQAEQAFKRGIEVCAFAESMDNIEVKLPKPSELLFGIKDDQKVKLKGEGIQIAVYKSAPSFLESASTQAVFSRIEAAFNGLALARNEAKNLDEVFRFCHAVEPEYDEYDYEEDYYDDVDEEWDDYDDFEDGDDDYEENEEDRNL